MKKMAAFGNKNVHSAAIGLVSSKIIHCDIKIGSTDGVMTDYSELTNICDHNYA